MRFELQPTLEGELVNLRPLRDEDWDALYRVASDPEIWAQHPAHDRWKEDQFRIFFAEAMAGGGAFAVIDKATNAIIGSTRYHDYDEAASVIELGWTFLARSHWGGRYNHDMKRLLLAHAFRFVERVVFLVGPDNVRSRTAVERIGGVLTGTRVDATTGRESVVYTITRPAASA